MKRFMVLAAVLALALPAITFAQAPDFSGTWKVDMSKSVIPQRGGGGGAAGTGGAPGGRMGGGPADITIKQTATELTITQQMGDQTRTTTYKLDGSPSTNPGGRGGDITTTSKWDGKKLATTWSQTGRGGETMQVKESIYMDGTSLVRETDRGGTVTKLVYSKGTT